MDQECCENTTDRTTHLLQEALQHIGSLVDTLVKVCYTTHLNTKGADMQTNCTALAKVTVNKRLNTYRIVFSFDQHNRITVRNAALVTGDICSTNYAHADIEIEKAINKAKAVLRTDNIVML